MKHLIVLLVLGFAINVSVMGQKKYAPNIVKNASTYVERVESNITLSKAEKEILLKFKCEHTNGYSIANKTLKGKPGYDEKRKELNKNFANSLEKAFGKKRSLEIRKASRVKK